MAPVPLPLLRPEPVFVDGCFGWLHRPVAGRPAPLGVVLAQAYAQEEICTHYGLMALAERLAAAGMAVFRFDYPATGDSSGDEPALATMEQSVVRAADLLRAEAGVGTIALVGLRLGAAVAARAAAAIDGVAGAVLLAPVVTGAAYLREVRASAQVSSLSMLDPLPKPGDGKPLNTNGFRWPGALLDAVATIDLATLPAPAPRLLIAAIRADRRTAQLATGWRAGGAQVEERAFADYDAYMQDPTTHEVPHATFAAVEAFLAELPSGAASGASAPVATAATLVEPGYEDVPLRFGDDDRVFGMLCRPRGRPAAPVAALLVHEGSSHHIGNGRAYVTLARRLATAGIASLRMDLTGMGDSPAPADARNPHYDPERLAEVFAGIDCLERQGFRRAVSFGLCSGAYTAREVAVGDVRVVGTFVVNLQKFIWHYGDDIRVQMRSNKRTLRSYIKSMRNPAEWRKALAGKADLTGIARVLTLRAIGRVVHSVRSLFPPAAGSEAATVRAQMAAMAERRVHQLLMFSEDDPGIGEMTTQFGRGARRLGGYAPARMVVLPDSDHHFNATDTRRRYFETVEAAMRAVIAEHSPADPMPAERATSADARTPEPAA